MNGHHDGPLRIAVPLERRYLSQLQPSGLVGALRVLGHDVRLIDPEAEAFELGQDSWLSGIDVVVSRGRSWGLLCLVCWAEARGVPVVNGRRAIGAVHNKAEMSVLLTTSGIPTPATFLGSVTALALRIPEDAYPVVVKPVFGDNGRGLRVVESAGALGRLDWPEPVAVAQRFVPGDGLDLKLYVIGNEVRAVRKPSPMAGNGAGRNVLVTSPGIVPVTPLLRGLAARCGEIFGLELFGVDCIETPDGPVVIEVNEFPNYSAIPDADEKLARHVIRRAERRAPVGTP